MHRCAQSFLENNSKRCDIGSGTFSYYFPFTTIIAAYAFNDARFSEFFDIAFDSSFIHAKFFRNRFHANMGIFMHQTDNCLPTAIFLFFYRL